MIPFFKKKKENKGFKPPLSGKLETTHDQLKAQYGNLLDNRLFEIDLTDCTRDYTGSIKVPNKIHAAVRHVLDDYLKAGSEFYFQPEEKKIFVFFSKTDKAVAELKVQVVTNELERVIEELKEKKKPYVITATPSEPKSKHKTSNLPEIRDLDKRGTLSANPDETELRNWASRALANMTSSSGYLDFWADIEQMAERVKIKYFPLWYVKNRILSGYVLQTSAALTPKPYDEQRGHEDLAVLGAAARQLSEMQEKNQHALLIVPVHVHTICDQRTRDLYNIYCRTIGPDLQRFIVLQLMGISDRKLTITDWEALKSLSQHLRSFIIDTGPERIPTAELTQMKFPAFGFNLARLQQPEDRLFPQLDNFADYYQKAGKSTFILGVDSHSLLSAALGAGFTYIAGEAIAPPLERPRHASFMNYEDTYRDLLN